jgi:hypothetical protein
MANKNKRKFPSKSQLKYFKLHTTLLKPIEAGNLFIEFAEISSSVWG